MNRPRATIGYSVESATFEARPGFYVYETCTGRLAIKGRTPLCFARTVMLAVLVAVGCSRINSIDVQRWLVWARLCFHTT